MAQGSQVTVKLIAAQMMQLHSWSKIILVNIVALITCDIVLLSCAIILNANLNNQNKMLKLCKQIYSLLVSCLLSIYLICLATKKAPAEDNYATIPKFSKYDGLSKG